MRARKAKRRNKRKIVKLQRKGKKEEGPLSNFFVNNISLLMNKFFQKLRDERVWEIGILGETLNTA